MTGYFITGTGTGVGKTLVTAALTAQLRKNGRKPFAVKPVISGYGADDPSNDTALLLQAQNLLPTQENIQAISPWRFSAPLAPPIAAAAEQKTIDFSEILHWCRAQAGEMLLIEGAGGVMSPLTHEKTMLDWMEALALPVILVAGSHLGTLSHILTAMESLQAHELFVKAVIISESETNPLPLDILAASLKNYLSICPPIGTIPRLAAGRNLWEHVPDLRWMDV